MKDDGLVSNPRSGPFGSFDQGRNSRMIDILRPIYAARRQTVPANLTASDDRHQRVPRSVGPAWCVMTAATTDNGPHFDAFQELFDRFTRIWDEISTGFDDWVLAACPPGPRPRSTSAAAQAGTACC